MKMTTLKNKENLKIDIANKIFKMLYYVEVECEKNYLFKKIEFIVLHLNLCHL